MANEKLFYVGVKALIRDKDNQVLLMKASLLGHSPGATVYWDIPGGRIEKGSTVAETLKREVEDETGITQLNSIEFLTSVISLHEVPLNKNEKAGIVLMIYTAEVPEGSQITLSPEHTEYEWINTREAARRLAGKYPQDFTAKLTRLN